MDYTQIEEIKRKLKESLPEKTYQHTLRTVAMAMELCVGTEADRDVVFFAALLHDCAKKMVPAKADEKELGEFLGYEKVLHAPLGALTARRQYGMQDERVLAAIRYHTTGRPCMTIEEQIVFLADAIEDGREYPGVERIREQTKKSIQAGILASFESTLRFESQNGSAIHPLTLQAMEYFQKVKGN